MSSHSTECDARVASQAKPMPFFSVIIATRNRPALFGQALESVLAQSCSDMEIIIVNDGSAVEHKSAYDSVLGKVDLKLIRYFELIPRAKGHGQSYALNFGADRANAPYLCFLDDDDCWTDSSHLDRAQSVIVASSASVDLYMTNQAAFLHGEQQRGPIWIEDLVEILETLGNRADRQGAHTITVEELLRSGGFCHLNTLIVRRALYKEIGGMDESIRWECDHDLYFRLIDRAAMIKYAPVTVAQHNIPDAAKAASMTTMLSEIERRYFQLQVFRRARYLSRHPAIRAHARRHHAYTLKRIAESLASAGRQVEAAHFAREALRVGPTVKWAGYTAWRTLCALGQGLRRRRQGQNPGAADQDLVSRRGK
jgi:glycosyltransferase involved in cell wall biosynthesis